MAEVLLFHHAGGQTPGFKEFAGELRDAGHTVHAPDLFGGRTFTDLREGVAYAQETGFDNIIERGVAAADSLPREIVYAGFSLGCMPAEKLAIRRLGARGVVLMSGFAPPSYFGSWPEEVPVQIHIMESDHWVTEEDLPAARQFADRNSNAELYLYPGDQHLFAEKGPQFEPNAAKQLRQRVFEFLARVD
ncbi:MAG TPA: alpha/beta fold hydrolase [Candidatus Dormibacteraeota bacterium]|nr:alpha/beta fold hydrolase [Candidatus Dormibacteraeota bacterium]